MDGSLWASGRVPLFREDDMASPPPMRPLVRFELHEAEDKRTTAGWRARAGDFIDSKLGTALLTFVFTVLLSGLFTASVSEVDKERDQRIADRTETMKRRLDLRSLLVDGLIDRATRASLVGSALAYRLPNEDLKRRWLNYEQSYEAYNKMTLLIRADTYVLSPPRDAIIKVKYRDGTSRVRKIDNSFSSVLDKPITASFNRIDRCLLQGYADRESGRGIVNPVSTLTCQSSFGKRSWRIFDESVTLRSCLATYLILLDDLITLRNKRDDPDRALGPIGRFLDARRKEPDKACAPNDFTCWEREAWVIAYKQLHSTCDSLGRKY